MALMFTIANLEEIAAEVIGSRLKLELNQSLSDIPGWDSLNNTLIALDISHDFGIDLSGEDMGKCVNFGDLVEIVNMKIGGL